MCGDFNSTPDSNVYGYLTDANHTVTPYRKVQKKKLGFYDEIHTKLD